MPFLENIQRSLRSFPTIKNMATSPITELLTPDELRPILYRFNSECEQDRQREVLKARAFHSGHQCAQLTKRLRQYIGKDQEFSLNYTATVVSAVAERLLIEEITNDAEHEANASKKGGKGSKSGGSKGKGGAQDAGESLKEWSQRTWRANRLDAKQQDIHEQALRDGEFFAIIDFDNLKNRPRLTPHKRYTSDDVRCQETPLHTLHQGRDIFTGDGEGVVMVYPNNDLNQAPLYAVKRWSEELFDSVDGKPKEEKRLCVYYPDRIITYARTMGATGIFGWQEIDRVLWVHPATIQYDPITFEVYGGEPLGIPVVHFHTPDLRPEAKAAWPIQRAINKQAVDLLQSSDLTAFRIYKFFGFKPVGEDGKPLKVEPGSMVGHETKKPGEAELEVIPGEDPTPLNATLDSWITKLAQVTDTPTARFQMSGNTPRAETLKEQAEPLMAKCRRRATSFGNAWEDAFDIARRLHNAFAVKQGTPQAQAAASQPIGTAGSRPNAARPGMPLEKELDEAPLFESCWMPFAARSADDDLKEQQVEQAKVQVQNAKIQIHGNPLQALIELDYEEDEATSILSAGDKRKDEQAEKDASRAQKSGGKPGGGKPGGGFPPK